MAIEPMVEFKNIFEKMSERKRNLKFKSKNFVCPLSRSSSQVLNLQQSEQILSTTKNTKKRSEIPSTQDSLATFVDFKYFKRMVAF